MFLGLCARLAYSRVVTRHEGDTCRGRGTNEVPSLHKLRRYTSQIACPGPSATKRSAQPSVVTTAAVRRNLVTPLNQSAHLRDCFAVPFRGILITLHFRNSTLEKLRDKNGLTRSSLFSLAGVGVLIAAGARTIQQCGTGRCRSPNRRLACERYDKSRVCVVALFERVLLLRVNDT